MEGFVQAVSAVLLTVMMILLLGKQGSPVVVLLSLTVCGMVVAAAVRYWTPLMDLLEKLEMLSGMDRGLTGSVFKIAGIGLLTEISAAICGDAGSASLGKMLQLLGSAVILWLCIPAFNGLLDLVQGILGGI